MGIFDKLFGKKQQKESIEQGLQKTREGFFSKITKAIAGKSTVDTEVLDNLEDASVSADVGIETTVKIIEQIEKRVAKDKYLNTSELNGILKEEIQNILVSAPQDTSYENYELPAGHKPHIILVVGVNGVGKTTTIGKLAHNFSQAGKSVLLGAADTFRAAAVDQLTIWSDRTASSSIWIPPPRPDSPFFRETSSVARSMCSTGARPSRQRADIFRVCR